MLCESGKPIVAHNCMYDMLFLMASFEGECEGPVTMRVSILFACLDNPHPDLDPHNDAQFEALSVVMCVRDGIICTLTHSNSCQELCQRNSPS